MKKDPGKVKKKVKEEGIQVDFVEREERDAILKKVTTAAAT